MLAKLQMHRKSADARPDGGPAPALARKVWEQACPTLDSIPEWGPHTQPDDRKIRKLLQAAGWEHQHNGRHSWEYYRWKEHTGTFEDLPQTKQRGPKEPGYVYKTPEEYEKEKARKDVERAIQLQSTNFITLLN